MNLKDILDRKLQDKKQQSEILERNISEISDLFNSINKKLQSIINNLKRQYNVSIDFLQLKVEENKLSFIFDTVTITYSKDKNVISKVVLNNDNEKDKYVLIFENNELTQKDSINDLSGFIVNKLNYINDLENDIKEILQEEFEYEE